MVHRQEKDPRVIRTKKLIQDALMTLVQKKDFDDITVKDISEKATINRATFYAHYVDKYVLLDDMISEGFDSCVDSRILPGQELTETTGKELILMVNEYHIAFFEQWRMDTKTIAVRVENIIKSKLENIIATLIKNQIQVSVGITPISKS
ncbi:TetR/AcrR family transcriptional regulator [Paenibacillus rhizoplanae]|uniref:TetR/AcrR family transcriptional regulator n=1 Tax=Paenibacillus rhizoplanae TaxID=1917181 RepID=UPI00361F9FC8